MRKCIDKTRQIIGHALKRWTVELMCTMSSCSKSRWSLVQSGTGGSWWTTRFIKGLTWEDDEVRIGQAGTLEAETFGYLAANEPAGKQPSDVCREQLVVCCLRANTVVAQSLLASVAGWIWPCAFDVSPIRCPVVPVGLF